jgi:acetyl esterase/lipase
MKPTVLRASTCALIVSLLAACGGGSDTANATSPTTPVVTPVVGTAAQTVTDLAYANTSSAQKLDLYVPAGSGPFPLVINIHGGAFKMGSKAMLDAPVKEALLAAGYAVASINYRLSSEAIFPAALKDAKAAVRFLRANAATYRLSAQRFASFGQSAGGNLASLLGTSQGVAEFDDAALGNAQTSSAVQAVMDWFGPSDFLQMDAQALAQGCGASDQTHNLANSPESLYLGAAIQTVPALAAKSNPITYISATTPPFLLQKGSLDCTVPVGQSTLLAEALKAAGVSVRFDILSGASHGGSQFTSSSNIQIMLDFLNQKLK